MNCCYGFSGHTYGPSCLMRRETAPRPLSEIPGSQYDEGEGCVTFTRTDGQVVVIDNVRVDSIGPSAEARGVIGVEFYDKDEVVHVPFVKFWTISY